MQLRLYVIDNAIEMANILETLQAKFSFSIETSKIVGGSNTLTLRKNRFPTHDTDAYYRLYIEK